MPTPVRVRGNLAARRAGSAPGGLARRAATEAADEGHEERFDAFEYFQQHISHSVSEFGESFGKLGDLAHVGDIGHGSDYSEGDFGLNAASNSNSGNDDTGFGELSAASN